MRWVTYLSPRDGRERAGVLRDGDIHGLGDDLISLLAHGGGGVVEVVPEDEATLRSPVPTPPSIRDFMAFEAHVATSLRAIDPVWYENPAFYFTNPAAVLARATRSRSRPAPRPSTTNSRSPR